MREYDFESSVGYWITLTAHAYQQRLNARLAPYGITFRQFQVLAWLVYEGPLSPAVLAEKLAVEPPTLTGILDRMEREGWVHRGAHPEDGRSKMVSIAANARAVWSQIVDCLNEMRAEATRDLSQDEVQSLMRLLAAVHTNLITVVAEQPCTTNPPVPSG